MADSEIYGTGRWRHWCRRGHRHLGGVRVRIAAQSGPPSRPVAAPRTVAIQGAPVTAPCGRCHQSAVRRGAEWFPLAGSDLWPMNGWSNRMRSISR